MSELTSQHHVTLEEIKRLESERDAINEMIKALRSTLPNVAPISFTLREEGRTRTVTVASQQVPISLAMAPAKQVNIEPRVTDHAVIAFLERRHGFTFDSARKELLSDTVRLAIKMGAQSVKGHGGKLILRGNQVVSFVPSNDTRSHKVRNAEKKRKRHWDVDG